MASDRVIFARSLHSNDGSGRTLMDVVGSGSASGAGAALGSGAFGKVGTYRYHGAVVAVKELKAGADEDSIGEKDTADVVHSLLPWVCCV